MKQRSLFFKVFGVRLDPEKEFTFKNSCNLRPELLPILLRTMRLICYTTLI